MKKVALAVIIAAGVILLCQTSLWAIPTFQVYIEGAEAGDLNGDQDTWITTETTFTIYVTAAYDPKTTSIDGVTLLISVPDGETGTITITSSSDEQPVLLNNTGESSASETNPTEDADLYTLEDETDASGYDSIQSDDSFLPEDLNINSHYPLQDDVSDFVIYDLLSFENVETSLNDYNAEDGTITSTSATGEQKEYTITYTGFSSIHIDAYGLVTDDKGTKIVTTWENNPGSHDGTSTVPESSTFALLCFGLGVLGLSRVRRPGKR